MADDTNYSLQNKTKDILTQQIRNQLNSQLINEEIKKKLRSSYVNINSENRNK